MSGIVKEFLKLVWVSDVHFDYPKSRVRHGFNPETIEHLAKYDVIMLGGDTADLHYIYHMNLLHALKEAVMEGQIPGEKSNPIKAVLRAFALICNFRATEEKDPKDFKDEPDGDIRVQPELKKCIDKAISNTIGYVENLCVEVRKRNPDAIILNLMGNHDNYKHFADELNKLQERQPNFKWHPEYYLIADGLYTHGDTLLRKQDLENREILKLKSYMKSWVSKELEGTFHNVIRNTVFRFWNYATFVVDRLSEGLAMQTSMAEHMEKIKRVFVGHMHSDNFIDYFCEKDGLFYTQGGSSVGDGTCVPVEVTIKTNGEKLEFTGKENNILLPKGEIMSVNEVDIPGLTHIQGAGWITRLANQFAPQFIKEQTWFQKVFNEKRDHWLVRMFDAIDGYSRRPGQGEWCVLQQDGNITRTALVR
jgi:hypothetical protein